MTTEPRVVAFGREHRLQHLERRESLPADEPGRDDVDDPVVEGEGLRGTQLRQLAEDAKRMLGVWIGWTVIVLSEIPQLTERLGEGGQGHCSKLECRR